MSAACAWCQDLAAKRADDALAERAAKAIVEVARLTEELAKTTVALNRAEQERDEVRAELGRLHRLAPIGQYTMSALHEHEIVRLGAALSRAEQERDEARSEVKRLQGLMHEAAVTLATTGTKWGHSGDEETGTHDEDCEACALEASIAMLLSGIDQETGGEP